jgi:hypothetical protein
VTIPRFGLSGFGIITAFREFYGAYISKEAKYARMVKGDVRWLTCGVLLKIMRGLSLQRVRISKYRRGVRGVRPMRVCTHSFGVFLSLRCCTLLVNDDSNRFLSRC